jgi:hypothetical protein
MEKWICRSTFSWPRPQLAVSVHLDTPAAFTPRERTPFTHCIGGWVSRIESLYDMRKWERFTLPGLELRALGHRAHVQWLRAGLPQLPFIFVYYTLCSHFDWLWIQGMQSNAVGKSLALFPMRLTLQPSKWRWYFVLKCQAVSILHHRKHTVNTHHHENLTSGRKCIFPVVTWSVFCPINFYVRLQNYSDVCVLSVYVIWKWYCKRKLAYLFYRVAVAQSIWHGPTGWMTQVWFPARTSFSSSLHGTGCLRGVLPSILSYKYQKLFPQGWGAHKTKLPTRPNLMPRLRMVEVYLHSLPPLPS